MSVMRDIVLTDLRHAVRSAWRARGLCLAAILILAAGISMSTAIVSVLHTVALRELPARNPDELVVVHAEDPSRGFDHIPITHAMFEEFSRSSNTLSSIGGLQYAGAWPRDFLDGDRHVRAAGVVVTGAFFETLGRPAAIGRTLGPTDYAPGAEPTIVISHGLWQRAFAGDPDILGRRLRFVFGGDLHLTVVGVMPREFRLPGDADYWMPLPNLLGRDPDALARVGIDVIGRLAPGASTHAVREELEGYLSAQTLSSSDAYARVDGVAVSLLESEVGDVRPVLWTVSGAGALLLLIACLNVAILLLMRNTRRAHELGLRSALGASGRRIAGQLMTESLVIAAAGGSLGFLLVGPILGVFARLAPDGLPRLQDLSVSGSTLLIGIGTTAIVAIVAGVLPSVAASRVGRRPLLRGGHGRSTGGRTAIWLRRSLVSLQFGLALMMLGAAGLVVRTLDRLESLEPGFEPSGIVFVELAGPPDVLGPPEATRALFERLLPALEARPGIARATALTIGPFSGSGGYDGRYIAEGQTPDEAERNPWLNFEVVSPGYFDVFEIRAERGRLLTGADREGAPLATVVSSGTAAAMWPGQNPIGRRIRAAAPDTDWYEVVGVVADTRYREYRDPRPSIYFTTGQSPYPLQPTQLAVRASATAGSAPTSGPAATAGSAATTGSDPTARSARTSGSAATAAAVSTIRQVAGEIEPDLLVAVVSTMTDLMREPLAQPRLNAALLTAFAGTSLGLVAVGLYGVLAFSVRQRRRELGIRQALGATRSDIAGLVLREGLIVSAAGAAIGVTLVLALGWTLRALLYRVSPTDPVTLLAALGFLGAVALGACLLPARHAAGTDPNELLRTE